MFLNPGVPPGRHSTASIAQRSPAINWDPIGLDLPSGSVPVD
jgi:hypothetical protein